MKKQPFCILLLFILLLAHTACKKTGRTKINNDPDEFIEYTLNGTTTLISKPVDTVKMNFPFFGQSINLKTFSMQGIKSADNYIFVSSGETLFGGQHISGGVTIRKQNPAQSLRTIDYYDVSVSEYRPSPYYAGTFSGIIYDSATSNSYPFSCRFRVKFSY